MKEWLKNEMADSLISAIKIVEEVRPQADGIPKAALVAGIIIAASISTLSDVVQEELHEIRDTIRLGENA